MPPGKRNKRGNRDRARIDGPNPEKDVKQCGAKPAPAVADDNATSKQAIDKNSASPNTKPPLASEEDIIATLCWICAEPVKYYSLSACNHRTCHICALRLRVLYEKFECTFCKESQSTVIFTTSPDTHFLSYSPNTIPYKDSKLSIFFETSEMMNETLVLLLLNCPGSECRYTASKWEDLKGHARAVHKKVFCDLCVQFKKVFAHEHALYPLNMLPLHLPSISTPHLTRKQSHNPIIEGGVHPLCEFCNACFFGDDELFVHMREQHEECFLCKGCGVRDQYFQNYDALESHFSRAHFACADPVCKADKFVVFDSEHDLGAHREEAHGETICSKDKKEGRRVQVESAPASNIGSTSHGSRDVAAREQEPRETEVNHATESAQTMQRPAPRDPAASVQLATVKPKRRSDESSAHDLISTVWNVLGQCPDDAASIVNAVVDFLGEGEKKYDLLTAWNRFRLDSEQPHPPSNALVAAGSSHAKIANTVAHHTVHTTLPRDPQQSPPDHYVAPTDPSCSSSFSAWDCESGFPSLSAHCFRPFNANVAASSNPPRERKSWASVAAWDQRAWSAPPPLRKVDEARPPQVLSVPQGRDLSPPSSAGPLTDVDVWPEYYYPLQSPRTWASLVSTDLSAWTPNWNMSERESVGMVASTEMGVGVGVGMDRSEMMGGQGKKGKGKQKQRVV